MKPILFNTEMVRDILDGRKSITRRVVEPQPHDTACVRNRHGSTWDWAFWEDNDEGHLMKMPYCSGDILYVRETWQLWHGKYEYRADIGNSDMPWRPSIHMPKKAARLFLRVTGVRVERLQEITELQILEGEGVQVDFPQPKPSYLSLAYAETRLKPAVKETFSKLWDSTIKKSDLPLYGWDANPWVWVIEFERISKEEAIKEGGEG